LLVLGGGWLLGGLVGPGTVIAAFAVGFFVQLVFRLFKFDAKAVRHESLMDTLGRARGLRRADKAPVPEDAAPEAD
jgi:hypothetical protein